MSFPSYNQLIESHKNVTSLSESSKIHDQRFFHVYGSSLNHMFANQRSLFNTISIMRESDFLCESIWTYGKYPFLVQIFNSVTNRNWFNHHLHSNLITGKLPEPILIPRCSTITIEFCNTLSDNPSDSTNIVSLALVGHHLGSNER